MMHIPKIECDWQGTQSIARKDWQCGNCGRHVTERKGYQTTKGDHPSHPLMYPCPNCGVPTLFWDGQHPGARPGDDVEHLPADVARIYDEARDCCRVGAYGGAALLARSLLMHIAVSRKAKEGLGFVEYVTFLEDGHYTPPDSKEWVDHIRKQGNRAAHSIMATEAEDAEELIQFLELILRYLYEFTGRMKARSSVKPTLP